jgi:1-phosphofructokinase
VAAVSVFAPSVLLTITIEDGEHEPEVHLHAGGQGFWVARLLAALGIDVELCAPLGGESGVLLRTLVPESGIGFRSVVGHAASGVYVHDRRSGDRHELARTTAQPLGRHQLDDLYGAALTSALTADVTVITGAVDPEPVPADFFGRFAADVRANERMTVCDVSGAQLTSTAEAGVTVAKVSHDELTDGGWATGDSTEDLIEGARRLQGRGAEAVVVSRASEPTLVVDRGVHELQVPSVHPLDHRGAGDSMTAGIAAGLATGRDLLGSAVLGAAAGALNATRRGLGSGRLEDIEDLCSLVRVSGG